MKRRSAWLSAIPLLAVMVLIFFFSAQSGLKSSNTSGRLTDFFIHLLFRNFDALSKARQEEIWSAASFMIRKLAHFSEFGALGFFACLHIWEAREKLRELPGRLILFAWGFASFYAVTDEIHQIFSDSRGPQVRDVLIDSAGAALGTALFLLLIRIKSSKKQQ